MNESMKINETILTSAQFGRTKSDGVKIRGFVTAELRGPNGELKGQYRTENIVTNAGRQLIIDRLQAGTDAVADWMAIGTGTNAPAAANTALQTETARLKGDLTQPTAHTDRLVRAFAAGVGTGTIAEVGRLNDETTGVLLCRAAFDPTIPKGADDSLTVTYDITYAAS